MTDFRNTFAGNKGAMSDRSRETRGGRHETANRAEPENLLRIACVEPPWSLIARSLAHVFGASSRAHHNPSYQTNAGFGSLNCNRAGFA